MPAQLPPPFAATIELASVTSVAADTTPPPTPALPGVAPSPRAPALFEAIVEWRTSSGLTAATAPPSPPSPPPSAGPLGGSSAPSPAVLPLKVLFSMMPSAPPLLVRAPPDPPAAPLGPNVNVEGVLMPASPAEFWLKVLDLTA